MTLWIAGGGGPAWPENVDPPIHADGLASVSGPLRQIFLPLTPFDASTITPHSFRDAMFGQRAGRIAAKNQAAHYNG